DGSPSLCSTATVNVTVSANTAPTAVIDSANTDFTTPITINVLGNDSDSDGGQEISITSITVAPDQGGSANINNNGTPSDPSDDFINYTPSGLYIGTETFTYQICDNAKPITCATATVYVNVATCLDGSTTESSPNFAFGAEWKYDDSGVDLGTSWRDPSYLDDCWAYGNANLGFGDPMTTTINNHGKITYYFRKHFNVVDAGTINYLKLDLVRDDGAVVYINGNEVLRSNMPIGTIVNTTAAASNVSGSSETAISSVIVTAEHLVDGDNVIAVEIHQDLPSSSDINFDLAMTADIVDHSSDIYIAQNQYWNYSDDGTDLNTGWRSSNYIENTQDWETGTAELGYGDGDESTTIGTGTVYPTYYFRHYFNADDILTTDSLYLRLRKDDGAIVYINGVEVYRHGMGTGTINYSDWASFTAAGADESKFYDTTILATMINSGINVVAVEVHQVGSSSSDVSFELELSRLDGDPNAYPLTYETISGKVFLDIDVNRTLNSKDVGQGAIEVFCYQDRDLDGEIDVESDPRLFSDITNAIGDYELKTYFSEVQSIKSDVTASNGDAAQDGLGGTMSLNSTKHKSIVSFTLPNQVIDTVSSWSYYDGGDLADPTWVDLGYPETGWSSGTADFGFGDAGVNTTVASGNYAYYFRKTFTGGILAGTYNTARILLNRDDGAVIYLNGVEIARSNMPSGPITYNTLAASKVDGEAESKFHELIISNLSFNVGTNVLAVEIHQDNVSSSDIRFDLMMSIENGTVADVGYRFGNVQVPQGAKIIDAFLRVTSATTTETTSVIHIEGEAADNAAVFANTINNISSRARTAETTTWSNSKALLDGREMQLTGLTGIVQEITDRAGWSSGNAMAFILSGFENEIYSFDGGYAPELTISYLDTNQTTTQYIISVDPADMPEVYTFLTDATPTVTIGTSLRAVTNVNLGYIGSTSTCFATSDDDYDALHIINRFSGKNRRVGALGSSMEIEAIAMSRNADSLFAVDGGNFGLIDLATGAFTAYGSSIGTADGAAGSINLSDVDGLSYDLTRNMLWASHRRSGDYDLIFVIDITTGQFIPDVFGPGVDYVVAQGGGLLHDLDDIAIHPNTGNLFAMNNDNGAITNLVEIDISTGLPNVINNTGLNDMEGQGFHNDGLFYSTSGREGVPANAFYLVDTSNSFLTLVGFFESEGDFEGCDCKTGPSVNFVDGYVFEDMDGDSLFTAADVVDPGVDVSLYRDVDSNGVYSIGDILVETKVSDSTGYYAFAITQVGYYFLLIDTADIPLDAQFTTEENQPARFNVNGQVQFGNNFGYRNGAALPVELAHFTGENKGQKNNLYWTTTAEINNDHFKVQRSKDAITFETIGVVNGAGNSDQKLQYEFVDDQPFKGVNYYRLQQVDFDGTNDYSKIIDLEVKTEDVKGKLSLDLFPNPSHDYIKINGLQELDVNEVVTLNVYDINGVVQLTKIWTISDDIIELDISEFKNGIYFADLSTSKGLLQTLNFIKQDR
ncbi:MAG: cadherin-like domain-containing protein, partial [Bacteroidetes bacterium]|nr:cadherin-like domain-containing protein [Bacteroidota bacterium]